MSNGYGTYRTNRADAMAAYDAAPPPLRWIMRNAVAKWSAKHLVQQYWEHRRAGLSQTKALMAIAAMIQREEAHDTRKTYGKTHPEAYPHRDH